MQTQHYFILLQRTCRSYPAPPACCGSSRENHRARSVCTKHNQLLNTYTDLRRISSC